MKWKIYKLVFAVLIILGALTKSIIAYDASIVSILLSLTVGFVVAWLLQKWGNTSDENCYIVFAFAVAALEILLHGLDLPLGFASTIATAALALITSISYSLWLPWLFFRFTMMTFSTDAAYETAWRLAQVLLFFTVCAQYFVSLEDRQTRTIATAVLSSVLLLYSMNDAVPHNLPVVFVAVPLVYVAKTGARTDSDENVQRSITIGVLLVICMCYLYPHHALVPEDYTSLCADAENTEPCASGMPLTYVTPSCCCKAGFVKMPQKDACVKEWPCQSNFAKAPQQDCCGINRLPDTEALLRGIYQCRCNNEPDNIQHGYDDTTNTCICQPPYTGEFCTVTTST